VDSSASVGFFTSIAIGADGFPVVSYEDFGAQHLKVAKCINAACTGAATITTVDSSASVGQYTSIAIGADALPVVSYFDAGGGHLKVAKCSSTDCSGSATLTTVDSSANVGAYTSIAIGADTLPVVSYQDGGAGHLKVAKCNNRFCQ